MDWAKIASLGVRIRQGCSYHGLVLNVAMDLAPFRRINPCGFPGLAITQVADLVEPLTMDDAALAAYLAPCPAAGEWCGPTRPSAH